MLAYLAPLLRQNGLDPNMVMAMMQNRNTGFGGEGMWFLWIIVILALFRNGNGFFGGNAEQVCNGNGAGLLSQYIATGNQSALSELSATLHCDVNALQTAINSVMASVQSVGNQVGLSGQQVINAIQLGNSTLASQLAECCCNVRENITRQGYENQIATLNQTNTLSQSINTVNTSVERGFASTAYETAAQTCDLKNEIAKQTTLINDKFCQLEMREMTRENQQLRDQVQAYRLSDSQRAQTAEIINTVRPCPTPAFLTCNPWASNGYGWGNGYGYGNNGNCGCNSGCNCGCGL